MSATGRSGVRHPDDFYRTPAWVTRAILPHLAIPEGGIVLDPACGDGAILDVVKDARPDVRTTGFEIDRERAAIAARRHGIIGGADALTVPSFQWAPDAIVMNPPFRHAMDFVERGIECAKGDVACLLRLSWMAGQKRAAFWREHMADAYVLPRRPSFTGKGTDASDYAWFVWGAGRGGRWQVLELEGVAA